MTFSMKGGLGMRKNVILKILANVLVSLSVLVSVSPASFLLLHQPKCPKHLK